MAGTVLGTLGQTHWSDGVDVATSSNKGGWTTVQNGSGNTWTFLDAARHGGVSGQRIVQGGSGGPVSNGFCEFTNTDPLFSLRWHPNFAATPATAVTFFRDFATSAHTTATSLGLSRGTDNKISIIEAGTTTLGTTSSAVPNLSDLILMLLQNGTSGSTTLRCYQRGTAALLVPELTVTMVNPFVVSSFRGGLGNLASGMTTDLSDLCAWGFGDWLARPDLATLTLTPPPDGGGAVVPAASVAATVVHGETGVKSVSILNGATTIAGPQAGQSFTLATPLVGTLTASVTPAT